MNSAAAYAGDYLVTYVGDALVVTEVDSIVIDLEGVSSEGTGFADGIGGA